MRESESSKNIPSYEGTKAFLKGRKTGLVVNVGQYPFSSIRIRVPDTDPDTGQPIQGGSMRSGSTSTPLMKILPRTISIRSPKKKEFSTGSGQRRGSIFHRLCLLMKIIK
jgi:hypothetical protein